MSGRSALDAARNPLRGSRTDRTPEGCWPDAAPDGDCWPGGAPAGDCWSGSGGDRRAARRAPAPMHSFS